MPKIDKKLIEAGIKIGESKLYKEDKVWSRFSNDKVDIGEELAKVVRVLSKALPLDVPIRALSIGSSNEPQFRILETACRGGLYLLDIEKEALDVVRERIRRQWTDHVITISGDYNSMLSRPASAASFFRTKLGGEKIHLITMHHSLYYSKEEEWKGLFDNLYRKVLSPVGAVHAVLMASRCDDIYSTTWLYNNFVGKYFGYCNNQDMTKFAEELKSDPLYKGTQIFLKRNRVRFYVDDFQKFMAVVWMIMLYPDVHNYSLKQREEITELVYKRFWKAKKPLVQLQDHLVAYRNIPFKGMI